VENLNHDLALLFPSTPGRIIVGKRLFDDRGILLPARYLSFVPVIRGTFCSFDRRRGRMMMAIAVLILHQFMKALESKKRESLPVVVIVSKK
jgi:hypothetical protein